MVLVNKKYLVEKKSFILTMWYVNSWQTNDISHISKGFILTMWYVNFVVEIKKPNMMQCFILTMWYVNLCNLE